jgi:tensin
MTLSGIPLEMLASFLKKQHPEQFMVWNLSDRTYNYSLFDNQVIEFKFPGYPAPPLDKIFSICRSIDGWLRADERNVAVIHCQTGRGRTAAAIACYLAWIQHFENASIIAIEHISKQKNLSIDNLLIPTQKRYLGYFDKLLAKVYPNSSPLCLDKIIVCVFNQLCMFI